MCFTCVISGVRALSAVRCEIDERRCARDGGATRGETLVIETNIA